MAVVCVHTHIAELAQYMHDQRKAASGVKSPLLCESAWVPHAG